MKLTNTKVKSLPVPTDKGQVFHWDSETRGFGLRVTSAGAKSWIVQGRVNGKTRRYTLGPFELLAADDARKRAQAKLLEMYDGKDPQVEKKKLKAQSETLREVMEDYVRHKRTKNGPLRPSSKEDIPGVVLRTPFPTGLTNLWSLSAAMPVSRSSGNCPRPRQCRPIRRSATFAPC